MHSPMTDNKMTLFLWVQWVQGVNLQKQMTIPGEPYIILFLSLFPEQIPFKQTHLVAASSWVSWGNETQMFVFPTGLYSLTHAHWNGTQKPSFGQTNVLRMAIIMSTQLNKHIPHMPHLNLSHYYIWNSAGLRKGSVNTIATLSCEPDMLH